MPSKQEEIREGIAREIAGGDSFGGYAPSEKDYKKADYLLNHLHSQGVVIKVDRELPKLSDYDTRQTTDSSVDFQNGFLVAKGAFIKAGYVAVEPLIED